MSKTIQHLHEEHQDWLSDIEHWERELDFLENMIQKIRKQKLKDSLMKASGELENKIHHHQRLLEGLKSTIKSHEAFMSDQLKEGGGESFSDHQENRKHIHQFKSTFKQLKHEVFDLSEEVL